MRQDELYKEDLNDLDPIEERGWNQEDIMEQMGWAEERNWFSMKELNETHHGKRMREDEG